MGRAPCCEKVGLKKGRWTAEEDEILTQYVKTNGEGSWRSLPKNAGTLFLLFFFLKKILLLFICYFFFPFDRDHFFVFVFI
jgi:hypothetical protein